MACVYRHIRLDTHQPFYIGIGAKTKRAFSKHKRTSYWTNIVNKCDYEVEILFDDLAWEDACKKEKEFIALYGRIDNNTGILVNLTDGGEGSYGYKHSNEDLIKIGEKSKGRIKSPEQIRKWKESRKGFVISDEARKKISDARKGKKHSEETIEKLRKSHTGKKASEETKEKLRQIMLKREPYKFTPEALKKLSESHKGIKLSEETKRKIGEKNRGKGKGIKKSPEIKAKLRAARTSNIKMYRIIDNKLVNYYSINEVVHTLHISFKTIKKYPERFGLLTFDQLPDEYKVIAKSIL